MLQGNEYVDQLHQDLQIRNMIHEQTGKAGVSKVEVERSRESESCGEHSQTGDLNRSKRRNRKNYSAELEALTGKKVDLEIKEIKSPDLDAYLVAMNIAGQIERGLGSRRAMKRAFSKAYAKEREGVKIQVGGRSERCGYGGQ
jgi:small subunit ribosomal protein S3